MTVSTGGGSTGGVEEGKGEGEDEEGEDEEGEDEEGEEGVEVGVREEVEVGSGEGGVVSSMVISAMVMSFSSMSTPLAEKMRTKFLLPSLTLLLKT